MMEPPALSSLSGLDWALLVILFFSTVTALRRGFIRVLFSILGLIFGVVIASWNYLRVANYLQRWISEPRIAQVIAFLLLMMGVMLVVAVLAGLLSKSISAMGLGVFNRILGAVFGFVRGTLICAAIVSLLVTFSPDTNRLGRCQLASYFLAEAHRLSFVVPQHLQEQLAAGTRHLLQQSAKPFRPEP